MILQVVTSVYIIVRVFFGVSKGHNRVILFKFYSF